MEGASGVVSDELRYLPFQLLTDITDNFSQEQKLGSGAFGDVYKGVLKDGVVNRMIAVKKLRFMPAIDDKQFKNELELLSRLKHKNIVQLVGFCNETEDVLHPHEGRMVEAVRIHRLLGLEFVPNGNLGTFLSEQRLVLDWQLRFKIIKGICNGLEYLHDVPLKHLDLKPDNILLDNEMVPKIADFGLSRLVGTEHTVMTLTPLGTLGYIPPEFINKQVISREFDIFSLGVIIKKMMTGVMDDSSIAFEGDQECIKQVHNYWKKKLQVMPGCASPEVDCKHVRTCIEIAVACMDEDPRRRPTMKHIVRKLNRKEPKETDSFPPKQQFHDGQPILPESYIPERPSPGVEDVHADSKSHKVVVKGKKAAADPMKVVERVQKKTGRKVELLSPMPPPKEEKKEEEKKEEEPEPPKTEEKKEPTVIAVVLKVHMHCEACAQEIKKRILKMKGVQSAETDLKASQVTVTGVYEVEKLVDFVNKRTGKQATIVKSEPVAPPENAGDGNGKDEKKASEGGEEKKDESKDNKDHGDAVGDDKRKEKVQDDGNAGGEEKDSEKDSTATAGANMHMHYPRYNYPGGYGAPTNAYSYAPQLFSDENPNACSLM